MEKNKDKHIVLMGFKNTGKSVLGKEVAERLGLRFLDLDTAIEQKYEKGMKCREIMEKESEPAFRKLETEALREVLSTNTPLILALGGGTVLAPENQELLKETIKVNIRVEKEILFGRIKRGGRPAFFGKEGTDREAFERIYKERQPIYEKLADVSIDNSKEIETAVGEIIKILNRNS